MAYPKNGSSPTARYEQDSSRLDSYELSSQQMSERAALATPEVQKMPGNTIFHLAEKITAARNAQLQSGQPVFLASRN